LEKSLQNPDVANYMDVTDYILSINLQWPKLLLFF
jgi:hypothetical protein